MKTKLIYAILAVSTLTLSIGCSSRKESKEQTPQTELTREKSYEGVYKGTLPCADCSGIETEITLSNDTYTLKTTYLGKEGNSFEKKGSITFDPSGNILIFAEQDMPNSYKVEGETLIALDMEGKPITGELAEMYVLRKQK